MGSEFVMRKLNSDNFHLNQERKQVLKTIVEKAEAAASQISDYLTDKQVRSEMVKEAELHSSSSGSSISATF